MWSCLKYLVLLFCLNFIECSFRCDYKYSSKAQAWFKSFVVPATWFDARLRCSLEGAVLASPTTPEIQAEMRNIINNSNPEYILFTGIHATVSQGDYYTIEGIPLSKILVSWAKNEPDNKDNKESCITFNGNGELADHRCDVTRPYICHRSESFQVGASECGTVDPECSFRCDYKHSSKAQAWFKSFVVPATWFDARLRCSLEGAVLASPTTPEIQAEMRNIINNSNPEYIIFTGIHATVSQGDYYTIEGIPLSKIPVSWAKNEPDNKDNKESCITFNGNGDLADHRCDVTRPYICYRSESFQVGASECGTVDPEYNLDKRTNKCYKFHTTPRNFSRAFLACSAEGGHLAIINSDMEAAVLKELFAKYPDPKLVGNFRKDLAFVGYHDWGENWDWRTIHGQTLTEAGYSKFAPGEPNNVEPGQSCGAMFRTGFLGDLWCDKPFLFFCEKNPGYHLTCHALPENVQYS